MARHAFDKFMNKPLSGAKKKEAIRQEKRKAKAEIRARGEEQRRLNEERFRQVKPAAPAKSTNKYAPGGEARQQKTGKSTKPAKTETPQQPSGKVTSTAGQMPLNKYIAHAGVCARREAADLVKTGVVKVNGAVITEPGFKVSDQDTVTVQGKKLFLQRNLVYILLNKPKDYITTAKDPEGRKTVFDLVKGATKERIYPVGRLDRNTTGVLLLTNDGELAQKLTHPSFEVKKIYEVKLDKPVTKKDLETLVSGVTLDDGFIQADAASYVDPKDKCVVGVEIHSGRNRIVRRIFEHLGYSVKNLDRVMFGNLTKKNVDRGKWRFLHDKEIRLLKFMNQSFVRNK